MAGLHDFLFTLPDKSEIERMEEVFQNGYDVNYCFVTFRNARGVEPFIDIYFWDRQMDGQYTRFVISESFYWTEEEEKTFKKYIQGSGIYWFDHERDIFEDTLKTVYPETAKVLEENRLWFLHKLLGVYYCLHWACPEHILYKCGLHYIGRELSEMEGCNREGSTPEEITGLPMKILRMTNSPQAVKLIDSKEKREKLKKIYYQRQDWFQNVDFPLSTGQCMLIEEMIAGFAIKKDAKRIFEKMEFCFSEISSKGLISYLKLRERIWKIIKLPADPELIEDELLWEDVEISMEYFEKEKEINEKLHKIWKRRAGIYEFENEKYRLRMPENLEDILIASEKLKNCLWKNYVYKLAQERTYVIFLENKESGKIIGAIEINRKRFITSALGKYNELLDEDAVDFIWKFAEKKGFHPRLNGNLYQ